MKSNLINYLSSAYFVIQPQYGLIKDTITLIKTLRKPLTNHTIRAVVHPIIQSQQPTYSGVAFIQNKNRLSTNLQPTRHITPNLTT